MIKKKWAGYQPDHDGFVPVNAIQKLHQLNKGIDTIQMDFYLKYRTSKGNPQLVHASIFTNHEVETTILAADLKELA
ncbi:hypothetical protein FRB95_014462 [Tulasnella sp. JGI-2019a]|nr:hypothetical protein FRB95_014462 [Tulasnella sp. JGI-2019a]